MATGFIALVLLLSLLAPLVLYLLISDETTNADVVDRETAEREAMTLGGRDARGRNRDAESGSSDSGEYSHERDDRDHWGYSRLEDDRDDRRD